MTKISNGKNIEAGAPHWIEWITGAVSGIIVVGVIVWIGKDGFLDHDTSPNLHGKVVQIEERSDGFQVLFSIENASSATASQVKILGEIREQGSVLESKETILDYVPGHSKAGGGLIFRQNPTGRELEVRATAFSEP
ncbi:hypothetical protein JZX87_20495 [Agrobacterium sp. Ap1]|jgi:uncharacterized protein (TIGR02588 family)|uniref:hypothetical protein n=1 Tax=Agrobacterium sp. Ap1 TaxID=2815337 RepID=UPI001A8C3D3F|nr:hypothetical protein [Agrobacterium sp. Ap1]MBO0143549.1 hypothetical protein [Agrobacterium sp. Ap1]